MRISSIGFLYLLNSRGSYRSVSSLKTAEFAQSLTDRTYSGRGTNSLTGAGRFGSGPRGIGALKFAPNENATTTRGSARSVSIPPFICTIFERFSKIAFQQVGLDSEGGVIITRETYVMTNFATEDPYTANRRGVQDSPQDDLDAVSYVIDAKAVDADDVESRKSDQKSFFP